VPKIIPLEEAVGYAPAHDITDVLPGEFKGRAFRKEYQVCREDLCRLQRLGRNHLYVPEMEEDEIRESEAAAILASAVAGGGIGRVTDRQGRTGIFGSCRAVSRLP